MQYVDVEIIGTRTQIVFLYRNLDDVVEKLRKHHPDIDRLVTNDFSGSEKQFTAWETSLMKPVNTITVLGCFLMLPTVCSAEWNDFFKA